MMPPRSSSSQIETCSPPEPGSTPTEPKLKFVFATRPSAQFATLTPFVGHFWPANCCEANQAVV